MTTKQFKKMLDDMNDKVINFMYDPEQRTQAYMNRAREKFGGLGKIGHLCTLKRGE